MTDLVEEVEDEERFVELAIAAIELGPEEARPAVGTVRLVDMASGDQLEIVMARVDAQMVQQAVASQDPPRPRTHDLVLSAIGSLGGRVTGARIVDRRSGGIYVAELLVTSATGEQVRLDARPSDALNVALRSSGAGLQARASLFAAGLN